MASTTRCSQIPRGSAEFESAAAAKFQTRYVCFVSQTRSTDQLRTFESNLTSFKTSVCGFACPVTGAFTLPRKHRKPIWAVRIEADSV